MITFGFFVFHSIGDC